MISKTHIFVFLCRGLSAAGVGSLSYADGDKYVGEWAAGKKNGTC